jgi:hypothetical protein
MNVRGVNYPIPYYFSDLQIRYKPSATGYPPTDSLIDAAWDSLSLPEKQTELAAIQAQLDFVPEPAVNWQQFLDACDLPAVGGNGVFSAMLQINFPLSMDAYQLMLRLKSGQGGDQEVRTLNFLYSLVVNALPVDLKDSLLEAIQDNNIPLSLS